MANTIELTGFVNNVRELASGTKTATLSVGVKTGKTDKPFKNGFINFMTKENLVSGTKVTIKGFVTFDFVEDKNNPGKEKQYFKVYANEVISE